MCDHLPRDRRQITFPRRTGHPPNSWTRRTRENESGTRPALGRAPARRQRCASPRPHRSGAVIGHVAALLCRDCGSRRCACWWPDPRRLASAPALSLALAEEPPAPMPPSLLDGTRTTRLAARGGRLHRPGDPRAGPRDADVTGRATASVGHRTAASRGETNGRAARTQAASWHDRSHYSGVVVPAMPMPRIGSSAPSQQAVLCTRF
jgi:hypothetical protein